MMKAISGFSLVELSIVLVILGLLTGGILTGQNLIRAAELRSVVTEFQRYQTATQTFRDKYFALPGDMRNATDFWGAAHATPATCQTTQGTGTQTCNGNGDGNVGSNAVEHFRFWQHLVNAGLVEGSYTGVQGSGGVNHHITSVNSPASRIANASWSVQNSNGSSTGSAEAFDGPHGNHFALGRAVADRYPYDPITLPEEAWSIDKKIDDGLPGRGVFIIRHYEECTDAGAGNSDDFDANYLLASNNIACTLVFRNWF
jgi:prepilin-type N-terminal cleavage/methylation domain-containing protein